MADSAKIEALYQLQEAVLVRLQAMGDSQFADAKLCGGTALSRFWLSHRISYDLDFFLPRGFKAGEMAVTLKSAGIVYETKDIVDDLRKANDEPESPVTINRNDRSRSAGIPTNQLHGYVVHLGQRLKVSFVEDAYFKLYPAVQAQFGNLLVRTEDVSGLYHRKLRTVAGSGATGDAVEGGRQKARDLFDLYVLSVAFMPIREFMASLPYAFPTDAFDNGLANMPWFDLVDELGEIVCDERWSAAKDVAYLQEALYGQIDAKAINAIEPWDAVSKKVYWDRDVVLDKWREMVHAGHQSYLPDAIATMDVTEFVQFYGAKRFVQDWPTLRPSLPGAVAQRAGTYDLAWSRLAGGGWNLRPVPDFHNMPRRRKQFMAQVALSPGKSIYELAKSLGMQYRRAHEHAQTLIKEGKLRAQESVENGHRKRKLFPTYGPL